MLGDANSKGILDLACEDVFKQIADDPSRTYKVMVSFVEVYNEKVFDLLSGSYLLFVYVLVPVFDIANLYPQPSSKNQT
jgi:hypothetical protein